LNKKAALPGRSFTHALFEKRKLPDYESDFITTTGLAYRRAHEILALGIEEEQFLKDVSFNRLALDAELYDIISLTDKDNRIDRRLFKVLGLRDVIDIGGEAETTAIGLMKLGVQ
jgi:hypothetical protein